MRGLISRALSFWRAVRRRSQLDREMEDEFRFHQERRAEDLAASGVPYREAVRRARVEFGSTARYREEGLESRGVRHFDELWSDVRQATRSLRKSPGFTAAAVLMLGLGIGVNSAVFSLISASMLRPLPFPEAERLVVLHQTYTEPGEVERPMRWSYPEFAAVRSTLTSVSDLAAYYADDVNLSGSSADPERVHAEMVSASYFPALGVQPALGRGLATDDSVEGAAAEVVLGDAVWSRRFGADPNVIGRRVLLNGIPLTVVGVAPKGFRGLTGEADIWFPQTMAPAVSYAEQLTSPQHFHTVIGRLRPGTAIEQAQGEVAVAGAGAAAAARAEAGAADEGAWGAALVRLDHARRHPNGARSQLVLAGAAVFVLLIAVVNLSSLLLARSTSRARETAVRSALGAGRLRLVRQGLVEGGLLGLLGGAAGVLLAVWSIRVLIALAPERMGATGPAFANIASFAEPRADWQVVAFAAVIALAVGLLAGLLPTLATLRDDIGRSLKTGARGNSIGAGSLRRPTVLSAAAVMQVACAFVLLIGAGLLLDALHRLRSIDPGFVADGIVTFSISPPVSRYGGDAAAPLLEQIIERIAAVPGVRSATVSLCTPYRRCTTTTLHIDGLPAAEEPPIVGRHYVGTEHFNTLGIPLLRGRALSEDDRAGRPRVAVINETAAERLWPGEDPIGKRVRFGSGGGFASPDSLTEIVGIVGDVLYAAPGEPVGADFYTSYLQFTWPYTTVIVRAASDPVALVPALRRAVADVQPNLPIYDVRTMRERAGEVLSGERFATAALGILASLGLMLAALGIYGIMAYAVSQRRREMGIRLALGSTPRRILAVVIGQGLALAAAGLAIGAAASLALGRGLNALIAGTSGANPLVYATVLPLLLAVAGAACYLPARAATRVNPIETIGAE